MLVRNTVSGVVVDLPAEKTLGHPWFGRFYVPADKPKNEVLAQPFEIKDGERKIIDTNENPDAISAKAAEPVEHKAIDGTTTANSLKAPKPSDIKKGEAK